MKFSDKELREMFKLVTKLLTDSGCRRLHKPLVKAAAGGDLTFVKFCIGLGIDPNVSSDRTTPLVEAAKYGHTDIVEFLLTNGAKIDKNYYMTALNAASKSGNYKTAYLLIKNGADVNIISGSSTSGNKKSALMFASEKGSLDIVQLLIENDASVNPEVSTHALVLAAEANNYNIVRFLVNSGADINIVSGTSSGGKTTTLIQATKNRNEDMVEFLLEKGADPSIRDWEDKTALDHLSFSLGNKPSEKVKNIAKKLKTAEKVLLKK